MNLKSGNNILYWRTGGVLMGTKVVKPVFLKNIHIEGQERPSIFLSLLSYQQKAHLIFIPCFYCILIPLSFPSQQESPTRPSASPARRAPSATPPAPPRVKPALGTPSLATAPVPARPVTPPPTTLVGAAALHVLFGGPGFLFFIFFARDSWPRVQLGSSWLLLADALHGAKKRQAKKAHFSNAAATAGGRK